MIYVNKESNYHFDDANVYRRKLEELEQIIARMGLEIGVLKQERAHLYLALDGLYAAIECDGIYLPEVAKAKAVLENIRIN